MKFYFTWPHLIIFASVIIYFIYDYFDRRQIKDEREELIRLKTFEFVQKANTFTLFLLSLSYFFFSNISGLLIIFILILSSLYVEIAAKFYYRKMM